MRILVPGGAGFIGSHTCLALLEKGYEITVIDSYINSSRQSLENVLKILKKKYNRDLKNSLNLFELLNRIQKFSIYKRQASYT